MTYTVAQYLSSAIDTMHKSTDERRGRAEDRAVKICREFLPSGSGFDAGTTIDFDKSRADKLIFNTAFHHMNENGTYDGWTKHTVVVQPSFINFHITVSGRDRNDIKNYIADVFLHSLKSVRIQRYAAAGLLTHMIDLPAPRISSI